MLKIITDLLKTTYSLLLSLFERPNGISKEALEIMNDIEKKFLLYEMVGIFKIYRGVNLYPYELYSIMDIISIKYKITYNLDLHNKLLNLCIAKMRSEEIYVKNKEDYNY